MRKRSRMLRIKTACFVSLLVAASIANAEPYLAVFKGMQCSACHSHPSGGGKRITYGNVFAQAELAAKRVGDTSAKLWTGEVLSWLSVGANVRGGYESVDVPGSASDSDFDVTRATVYLEATLIPNHLSIYLDEKIAPDDVDERELCLKLKSPPASSSCHMGCASKTTARSFARPLASISSSLTGECRWASNPGPGPRNCR